MGLRNLFRILIKGGPAEAPTSHSGHDVADTVRDAIGPLGGAGGGRGGGHAVYKHLEKTVGPNNAPVERKD